MIDLACAIEVFQTAALVHDDIIDESDLRRGRLPHIVPWNRPYTAVP